MTQRCRLDGEVALDLDGREVTLGHLPLTLGKQRLLPSLTYRGNNPSNPSGGQTSVSMSLQGRIDVRHSRTLIDPDSALDSLGRKCVS